MAEKLIDRKLIKQLHEKDHEMAEWMRGIDWRNPASEEERYLFASEVVRQASDLVELVDPTPLLLEQRTLDPSVTNIKFRDTVGYEARTVTSGGYKETIRIDNEITSLPIPRRYDHVTIEMLKEDLEVGTYEDVGAMREGIAEALLRKKINTVWAACNDAITTLDETGAGTGNDNEMRLVGGTLTEYALDTAIDHMDSYGGGVFSIVGHPNKLSPIPKSFSGFVSIMPETVKQDYWRTGYVGLYRGANIIKLPSVVDKKFGIAPTDDKAIFVLGAGLGEIAQIKGVTPDTWDDKHRDIQFISASQKYVVLTWQPKGAFKIRLF